jgi:hypothetical protein
LQKNVKTPTQTNRRPGLPEENGCDGDPKWLEVQIDFDPMQHQSSCQTGMLFSERRYADD